MAKTSREALREKIAAIAEDRKAQEYGPLREVAAREPEKVGEALGELAHAASAWGASAAALRENLDLVSAPHAASLRARTAARRKYAAEFRRIAEVAPEQVEDAVVELYRSIDEIAAGLENLASHLGIDLAEAGEEEVPPAEGAGDGDEGLHGEMPIGGDLEPGEESGNSGEELPKEAADAGSDGFVTDRDEEGAPKAPDKMESRTAMPSRVKIQATGGGGFITDRNPQAEPKPVEKAEIPVSQGEAAVKQK
jgi:hypothetical protein